MNNFLEDLEYQENFRVSLDEIPDEIKNLGRILAYIDICQRTIQGKNQRVTLVTGLMQNILQTPANVMPNILTRFWLHTFPSLEEKQQNFVEKQIKLLSGKTNFPAKLSAEQQASLMLGFSEQTCLIAKENDKLSLDFVVF